MLAIPELVVLLCFAPMTLFIFLPLGINLSILTKSLLVTKKDSQELEAAEDFLQDGNLCKA